jgi:phosphatidylglycerophosphate synthase
MYERRVSAPTAAAEKRLMLWIAARLPARVGPDAMTAFGVAGAALVFVGFVLSNLSPAGLALVPIGLIMHWLGDSIDGNLARLRKIERERYGGFLDQMADILSVTLITVGVGVSPYVRMDVALLALAVYFALAVFVHARARATAIYDIAPGGVGPTEARAILILMTISMALTGPTPVSTWPLELGVYDLVYLAQILWASVTCVVETWRTLKTLDKEDPPGGG